MASATFAAATASAGAPIRPPLPRLTLPPTDDRTLRERPRTAHRGPKRRCDVVLRGAGRRRSRSRRWRRAVANPLLLPLLPEKPLCAGSSQPVATCNFFNGRRARSGGEERAGEPRRTDGRAGVRTAIGRTECRLILGSPGGRGRAGHPRTVLYAAAVLLPQAAAAPGCSAPAVWESGSCSQDHPTSHRSSLPCTSLSLPMDTTHPTTRDSYSASEKKSNTPSPFGGKYIEGKQGCLMSRLQSTPV